VVPCLPSPVDETTRALGHIHIEPLSYSRELDVVLFCEGHTYYLVRGLEFLGDGTGHLSDVSSYYLSAEEIAL